jgi:hypothetical protein
MIVEFFTHIERLPYLQREISKLVVLSEPIENEQQVKVSIDIVDGLDIMNVFHAGISYGMDTMSKGLIKK